MATIAYYAALLFVGCVIVAGLHRLVALALARLLGPAQRECHRPEGFVAPTAQGQPRAGQSEADRRRG